MEGGVQKEFQGRFIRMKSAAVLGLPIKHSLSPSIHNAAYKKLGIDATYIPIEVGSGQLGDFLKNQLFESSWMGFSLTMPLKEELCTLADSLGIALTPVARRIYSANTIYRERNSWRACSTDVDGFAFLLSGRDFSTVSILGAGGTARAAIESLKPNHSIRIFRRNNQRDHEIAAAFPERKLTFQDWSRVEEAWNSDLVINTVPVAGMNELLESFSPCSLLIDALYEPWVPPLAKAQESAGQAVITGLDLLCAQAVGQISLMTGASFSYEEMFRYLRQIVQLEV